MLTTHAHMPDLALQPHTGSHAPPAACGHIVVFDLGDGTLRLEHADDVYWGPGDPDMGGAGRVIRYAVMVPTATLASA